MSSLWNALTGTSKSSQTQAQPQAQSHSLPPTGFSEPAEPSSFAVSLTPGTDAYLQSSTFADPSLLHPLAGLDKNALEYLTLDESALSDLPGGQSVLPSRGFTDDLCYGTGITYLTALSIGGAWGLQEGLRRSDGQPPKLRLNSVLNAVTRRGPFLGNSAGAVAITYNCINSLIGYVRGKHAASNSVLAGALSGMVFKSTRGLRPMMISGGIVGSIAAVWAVRFDGDDDDEASSPRARQPTDYPQVGPAPGSGPAQGWYTAADPTRSLGTSAYTNFFPTAAVPKPGQQPQPFPMADYQNAVPHPAGVNFQPPVPDNTFGPIPHLYVPRFDPQPAPNMPGAFPVGPGGFVAQPPGFVPQGFHPQVFHPQGFAPPGFAQPGFAPQAFVPQGFIPQGFVPQGQQPVMINGQAFVPVSAAPGQPFNPPTMPGGYVMVNGAPVPIMTPGNDFKSPDVSGMGRTPNEESLRQIQFAYANRLFEPQDFKPGDDDPSRFYYVREIDGNWTQRNRYTIDQMACRWYVTDEGWFYAVRLPD
ncbi:hypothetical protein CP532_1768 [Ophiocordyceps camponoti-leonardi (nom. inval.)]|nr:hypothetical protein CP532_1768 [Ophiocordyceps camponoti-leonardi (nom. inval.)]